MGILIKGIDLPEAYTSAWLTVFECVGEHTFMKTHKVSAEQIQAIPPHGHLIDGDMLESLIYERLSDLDYKADAFDVLRIVQEMSAIIEAEEGEKA